jgi:hypothetical protein
MTDRVLRLGLLTTGTLAAVLAAGYFMQAPWALATWPWQDGRLSNIFVSSILAAVAVSMLWVGAFNRLAGAAGGFLHVATMLAGMATVLFPLGCERQLPALQGYAIGCALGAGLCLGGFAFVRRKTESDRRPLPSSLRVWCVLYLLILLPAGTAMVLRVPGIMPWPIKPETAMVYGWVFLAAAWSFLYPLLRPRLEHVRVGLLGFLAYDAVLMLPFLRHFDTVRPELRTSLQIYVVALSISAAVSVYYLFICRVTRPAAR